MKNKVFIISGKQGGGKTTYLQMVIDGLKKKDIKVGGIVAEGSWKDNTRNRFELIDLKTDKRIIFCQRDSQPGWEKVRHFYINPLGQSFGEKALDPDNLKNIDLVIIDEVGPFEIEGKGWANSLDKLFNATNISMVIVVRESIVWEVLEKWNSQPEDIFHVSENEVQDVCNIILKHLLKSKHHK